MLLKVESATVGHLLEVNKILEGDEFGKERLRAHAYPETEEFAAIGWPDAAESTRPDGSSIKGTAIEWPPHVCSMVMSHQ